MRNYSQDATEKYYEDEVKFPEGLMAYKRMMVYFTDQRNSVLEYFNKIRLQQTTSVLKMLEVVLSTGNKGYFMSTLTMEIKDDSCPKLLCHMHQPKM